MSGIILNEDFENFMASNPVLCMRYVRSVIDYLACRRVCGRYVISEADVAG